MIILNMSDPQFLFDLILLNFLPPAARATVFLILGLCAWIFIGWYYPIENIKDPQKKSKTMYYLLLCICGILPIILTIVGIARSGKSNSAMPAPPPSGGLTNNAALKGAVPANRVSAPY